MRTVFVYKGRYHVRDSIAIEYCSALARERGIDTQLVYDQDVFGVTDNILSLPPVNRPFSRISSVVRRVVALRPDLVVFLDGFNRGAWNAAVARRLKASGDGPPVLLIAISSDNADLSAYDCVALGEPEQAFSGFLDRWPSGAVPGAVFRADPSVADLDALPLPDKHLFAPYVDFRYDYMIFSARGCPYSCSFCEESVYRKELGKGFFRARSVESVIAELEAARRDFGITEVIFKDAVFTADRRRLEALLAEYRRRIGVPFKCFGKAETIDDDVIRLLKESGCYCIEFGSQTFNEDIKREVLNRGDDGRVREAFAVCDRQGLKYDVDHMFGLPKESVADHKAAALVYLGLRHMNRVKCMNLVYYRKADIFRYAPEEVRCTSGDMVDFFSSAVGAGAMKRANTAFTNLYKMMPLLPRRVVLSLLKGGRWKLLLWVPYPVVVLFQIVIGWKNGDLRFRFYGRYYPRKIVTSLLAMLRGA